MDIMGKVKKLKKGSLEQVEVDAHNTYPGIDKHEKWGNKISVKKAYTN